MSDSLPPAKLRKWRKWPWIVGLLLLLSGIAIYWLFVAPELELANLLAELDRENPGWRIEGLEARREQVPDRENGALVVLRVESKLPADWSDRPGIRKVHWHDHLIWPPAMRLPAEEAA